MSEVRKALPSHKEGPVIDASLFGPSLSHEFVTSGEIEGMLMVAENLLDKDGIQTNINGITAIVTEQSTEVAVDGSNFYAKVFRMQPTKGDKSSEVTGIVFDETPDRVVLTPNPLAIRFVHTGRYTSLVVDKGVDPLVDDPVYVEKVKEMLKTITEKVTASESKRDDELRKQREEQAEKVRQTAKRLGKLAVKYAPAIGGTIVALGVTAAAIFGLSKLPGAASNASFDKHNYTLANGQKITLGQTASPEFSTDLLDRSELSATDVPDVSGAVLKVGDGLREVSVYSSKPGKNCGIFYVGDAPTGTVLEAWSDFVGPENDAVPKANELKVTYNKDQGQVCWTGPEESNENYPRVVLKLEPPQTTPPQS